MAFEYLITKAELNPKKIFLVDGLGAMLSAFLLVFVLARFEPIFGIPPEPLYFLSIIPILFAVYDLYAYQKKHQKTGPLLKGIALLNLIYCLISIGLILYHFATITLFGWLYILLEIVIVLILATIECRVGRKINNTSRQKNQKSG